MQEQIILSSSAINQVGAAKCDGTLSITTQHLEFKPLNTQLSLGSIKLDRNEIESAEPCIGTGGGIIPISADAIKITLKNKKQYEFILTNKEVWLQQLNN
ncbi:hypothetical protein HG263_01795 [Pseudoalteromonas sp. JBTF-M23]|uniref:GRAM domain-containing protein n=1 Tax=Pseudoalteromonas caenipelagi TaxID=2726988 RepID=A0A849V7T4_9GAMM|nr:hypothetical protein [Pseudoalteromonas caenipelagi]NOU49286.1 hypothetical protein [Pseudoalteromonas caenipelagi]